MLAYVISDGDGAVNTLLAAVADNLRGMGVAVGSPPPHADRVRVRGKRAANARGVSFILAMGVCCINTARHDKP